MAWLHGNLTRGSRDDDRWEAAIADLSNPELLVELRESGPNTVGLDPIRPWRGTKIEVDAAVDSPVDGPSRQTLAYAAGVTDGHRTVNKPIARHSHCQVDGRSRVTVADQRCTSEV